MTNRIPKFYRILKIAFILFVISFCVSAQEGSFKFGVVDTQQVFENYKKAQQANDVLKTAQDRLTTQLKGVQKEIETMEERLTRQKLFLDQPETDSLENDIRLKKQELQHQLEAGQDSILAKQKELVEPILEEIENLLQQIGESENYSLILEKRLVTLYVHPRYDLTERVLKSLNDQYEKENLKDSTQSSTPPNKEKGKEEQK